MSSRFAASWRSPLNPSTSSLSGLPILAGARRGDEMTMAIQRVHVASFGLYGTRQIWHQLRREGVAVAKCAVERLTLNMGFAGVRRGRQRLRPSETFKAAFPLDKVNREIRADRSNALWVVYFTYVHISAGLVYVAFVIDVLEQVIRARRPGPKEGLIHHND